MTTATPAIMRATVWMMGTLVSFAVLGVATRELSAHSPFQLLLMRTLIGLIILAPFVIIPSRWQQSVRTRRPGLQILRNLFHFSASIGWYYGIAVLPLASVFAIEFTAPIWAAILAVIILRERLNVGRITAIALGLVGTVIILRPGFSDVSLGAIVVLGSALGFAISHITTKKMTERDTVFIVLFYMSVIQLPLVLWPAIATWTPLTASDIPWVLLMGIVGLTAHFCLTRALNLADATVVIPLDFLRVPLIAVVGFLVYSEALDPFVLLGALVIFGGNYFSLMRERRSALKVTATRYAEDDT
jgi:drug/metabolite transporter (DMT)-like permease